MNYIKVKDSKVNAGKETVFYTPLPESETRTQLGEIFEMEHYRDGKVKDGIYVDLGANIGLVANYFKDYAKEYYAVEPSKECFEALEKNTQDLPIKRFNFAILPVDGEETLYRNAQDSVPQTFFSEKKDMGGEKVPCKRIDTFFQEQGITHVDVLKIDVESSEFLIFPDDSFKNVAQNIDLIVGEAHYNNMFGGIPQMIPLILKDYGFTTTFTDDMNFVYKFIYKSPSGEEKKYEYDTNTIFVAKRL